MAFSRLDAALQKALADRGYHAPTPVQAAILEAGAERRDLLVSAQTGSGKTVAYGMAIAGDLMGVDDGLGTPGAPLRRAQATSTTTTRGCCRVERAWIGTPARAPTRCRATSIAW